ncbi:MAG: hypothetical protein JO187_01245, partial [Acidobacteria bacterium]|nr:hypothetical protein [Acidobacteriota bacterium]
MNLRKISRTFVFELLASGMLLVGCAFAQNTPRGLLYRAVTGKLPAPQIQLAPKGQAGTRDASAKTTRRIPYISGGLLHAAEHALKAASLPDGKSGSTSPNPNQATSRENMDGIDDFFNIGLSLGTVGCSQRVGDPSRHDVRVNQDCGYELQGEEIISYNPQNPRNLLAGFNDERTGQNLCGIGFSVDNGRHWGDMVPQFRGKLNDPAGELPTAADPNKHTLLGDPGTFHSYDFASDPGTSFEQSGTAHFSCVAADIVDPATMIFVLQSPPQAYGSFFTPIGTLGRRFVASEDNNPNLLYDKPFSAP